MGNQCDQFFDPNAKPLRRDANLRLTIGPDGKPVIAVDNAQSVTLSDTSIDQVKMIVDRFYHCGHTAEEKLGGQCAEGNCKNISCQKCFTRCVECHKPLCLEHLHRVSIENVSMDLCGRCKDTLARKQRRRAILNAIISPFVRFDAKPKS